MGRYTPEFLAVLRWHYERTQQSERTIARKFGLANSSFRQIARKHAWVRPPEPIRDLEPTMRLLEQVTALVKASDLRQGDVAPGSFSEAPRSQIPFARYTPRLLAALRKRYEQTTQSKRSIAHEFGISDRTLRRIAAKRRWTRPDQPQRDIEPAARLLEEVTALERRYFGSK